MPGADHTNLTLVFILPGDALLLFLLSLQLNPPHPVRKQLAFLVGLLKVS